MKNSFELLIRKDIIQILDGDEKLMMSRNVRKNHPDP